MVLAITLTHAQEYKLSKSTGKLDIKEVNHVTIEGTTGNEIIFSTTNHDKEKDERAQGLRAVSGYGLGRQLRHWTFRGRQRCNDRSTPT